MKKSCLFLLGVCFSFSLMSQGVLSFEKEEHDFGKIIEDAGSVSFSFNFTNTGDSALILVDVKPSCGCTSPSWPRKAIEPGEKEKITVSYNPKGRPGFFKKSIAITLQDGTEKKLIYIKGEVLKKEEAQPVDLKRKKKDGEDSLVKKK